MLPELEGGIVICVFLCFSVLQTDREVRTTELGMQKQDQNPCWWTSVGGQTPWVADEVCVFDAHVDFSVCIINMLVFAWVLGDWCLGLFLGGREVSAVTGSAVLNCGRKRADATGVDVWHDLSQQARCRELGAAAGCVCLCVCQFRREIRVESRQLFSLCTDSSTSVYKGDFIYLHLDSSALFLNPLIISYLGFPFF